MGYGRERKGKKRGGGEREREREDNGREATSLREGTERETVGFWCCKQEGSGRGMSLKETEYYRKSFCI